MQKLLIQDEEGNIVFNVFKVVDKKGKIYWGQRVTSPIGSYIMPVKPEDVIESLARQQVQAQGQEPVWDYIETKTSEEVDKFLLAPELPIPNREHYIALTKLYALFCVRFANKNTSLEVGTKIFMKDGELFFFMFEQRVTSASVNWTKDATVLVDIVTGDTYQDTEMSGLGYRYVGLSHSHNTMNLDKPSSTDDAQEIKVHGLYFLHSTFKKVNTATPSYIQTVTTTTGNKRYTILDYVEELTEEEWLSDITFHETVLSYIKYTPTYAHTPKKGQSYYLPAKPKTIPKSRKNTYDHPYYYEGEVESWEDFNAWVEAQNNAAGAYEDYSDPQRVEVEKLMDKYQLSVSQMYSILADLEAEDFYDIQIEIEGRDA